jgi:hypothetical protein
MNVQKGKVTFLSVIAFCILVMAALIAFKYFANSIEKKQIHKEVVDTLGVTRNEDITDAKVKAIIEKILKQKSLEPLEVYAEVDRRKGKIHFSFKYEISTNYLLFKRNEIVEIEDEIDMYVG